ncbi:MAG: amidohydrolase family protein [Thermoguttaceae bacterium]|nr:amidohydrolase family protein [Thermoguttaceae bacterium]MDW8079681.1 amidohydrolase family protein [Thermoguttaceae bacterium]
MCTFGRRGQGNPTSAQRSDCQQSLLVEHTLYEGLRAVIVQGIRYDTGQPARVTIEQGRVRFVAARVPETTLATRLPWLVPGLLDIQVNGYGGQEFASADLTEEKVRTIAEQLLHFGVTRFCPTLTTQPPEVFDKALSVIARACESDPWLRQAIVGIHLEGPFLSPEDGARGAHPREWCQPPDWELFCRWQEKAGGRIRLVTLAPELPGATDFIEKVAARGVIVGIGHTMANSQQIRAAVEAGARLSTHLGNGCPAQMHRHHNPIWPQLAEDRLIASFIADGHHLPAPVLKSMIRAKGPSRSVLISDLSGQAGQPPGVYRSPFCDVEILPDGRLVVPGQREYLAGASAPLLRGVAIARAYVGVDWAVAFAMASKNPATLLGLSEDWLREGEPPNFLVVGLQEASDENPIPEIVLREVVFSDQRTAVGSAT